MTIPDVAVRRKQTTIHGRFAALPEGVLLDHTLSDGAKVLYAHLWHWSMFRGDAPTEAALAEQLRVTARTIRNRVRELRESGYLERESGPGNTVPKLMLHCGKTRAISASQKVATPERIFRGPRKEFSGVTLLHERGFRDRGANAPRQGFSTLENRGSEGRDNVTDFKSRAAEIQRKAEARIAEVRAKQARSRAAAGIPRRKAPQPLAAPQGPRSSWTPAMLHQHFLSLYREAYPDELMTDAELVGPKGLSQLKQLRRRLTSHLVTTDPHEALATEMEVTAEYLDYVFKHRDRLAAALKIHGTFTPGVLLGFCRTFLADKEGTLPLRPGMAQRGPKGPIPALRTTSTALDRLDIPMDGE